MVYHDPIHSGQPLIINAEKITMTGSGKEFVGAADDLLDGRQRKSISTREAPRHRRAMENPLTPSALRSMEVRAAAMRAFAGSIAIVIGKGRGRGGSLRRFSGVARRNRLVWIFFEAQQAPAATPGADPQAVTEFSSKRIQMAVMDVFCLRCSALPARGSHTKNFGILTDNG
jgi:hypothetical protein